MRGLAHSAVLRSLFIPAARNAGLRPAPASHFPCSFCHASVVDRYRAVLSVALTQLILDLSFIIGYSCMVWLADG
jgi:hypothetical protein